MGEISGPERPVIEDACERLVKDYCYNGDFRIEDGMGMQFAEDAEFVVWDKTYVGRAAIKAFLKNRDPSFNSMHSVSNIRIDITGPTQAKGVSYVTAVIAKKPASGDGPAVKHMTIRGAYIDTFAKTAEGWKIHKRAFHELIPTEMH